MEENSEKSAANGDNCKFSFKKFRKGVQKSTRKRVCEKSSSSEEEETVVVKKERKSIVNPMIQSTKKNLKSQISEYSESDSETSENDDISINYKSKRTGEREGPSDMGATLTLQIDTAKYALNPSKSDDKEEKKPPVPKTAMIKKGPIRAPENVRATVRWDYQPDICKDYKETGFCGFGDSCKFLHDRSDYKFGWQLEMEENNPEKEEDYEIPEMKDNLPFKCFICRDSFKDPVVTKCLHYFCEKCALDHYKKTSRCYVCSTQTHGVFNPAREITARLAGESSKQGQESDLDDEEEADNVGDVRRTKEEYEFNDEDAYTDFD